MRGCLFKAIFIFVIVMIIVSVTVNNSDKIREQLDKSKFFGETIGKFIKYKSKE